MRATHPYQKSIPLWWPAPSTQRWILAGVLAPLVVLAVHAGTREPWLLHFAFALLASWSSLVLARLVRLSPSVQWPLAAITGAVYVASIAHVIPSSLVLVALGFVVAGAVAASQDLPIPERITCIEKSSLVLGATLLPLIALGELQQVGPTPALLVLTLAIAWASDLGLHVVGSVLGSRHIAPALAPTRTWEGAAAGVALAVAAAVALKRVYPLPGLPTDFVVVCAVLGSIAAQSGTLLKAIYKRARGLRDSGTEEGTAAWLVARLDGALFAALAIWLLSSLISM